MTNNRLKIGFLTSLDPKDKRSSSGSIYYMANALQKHCGDVYYFGPLKTNVSIFTKCLCVLLYILSIKKLYYAWDRSIFLSKSYCRIIEKMIKNMDIDLIFAPMASTEIAFLNTEIPIVYTSDLTFSLINDYYSEYSNLLGISKKEGNYIESQAIKKANLTLYSTKWAANSAIEDHGADESKVHIIPFGANLDEIPLREKVLQKKKSDKCVLLFLGVDWDRKGGKIAFETLLELEKMGLDAELTVCGCTPPKEFMHEKMKVIPFLDKNDPEQYEELENLFLKSNFLILPTCAEAYGVVYCESNAFGLPVITTDTGGVSGIITNGVNGYMLSLDAKAEDYAKLIYKLFRNDDIYFRLMNSSRKTFEEKLNWDKWGKEVCKLINELL